MKIKCKRDEFARVFAVISSINAKNNVKIAVDSAITLTAAGGGIGGRGIANGVIERPGEVVLNAALLKKILAEMSCEEFALELDGAQALLTGGRCKYRLDTYDAQKFPVVEPFDEADYTISAKPFQDLIRRTVFATDLDNTHYDLGCVKLIIEPGRALGVATDGRRLAYQAIKCETDKSDDALIYPRTLNLIDRVITATNAEGVLFTKKNSQVAFKIGDFEFTSVVKEGKFPDWRSILPNKSDCKRVDFIAGELARAVRQAEIVATENKPGVALSFSPGFVNISAAGEAIGESSVDLPIDYDGEEKRLRLDPRFLNDFFKNVGATENVAFYFGEDYRTMLETADGYQYIVMQLA